MHLRARKGEDYGANSGFKSARMTKLWQFSQGHPKPAFSEKVQRGDDGKFFKNRLKSKPLLNGRKALLRKGYYPRSSMLLRCKDWRRFCANSRFKSAGMAKLWQFSQGHPKPAFSEKVQRGDQGKFFKNRPKNKPSFNGRKALLRKGCYPRNSMLLRCKDWRRFRRRRRLQTCPNGEVMAIFARSLKTRIFWKSAKGGPREIFQKSPKK